MGVAADHHVRPGVNVFLPQNPLVFLRRRISLNSPVNVHDQIIAEPAGRFNLLQHLGEIVVIGGEHPRAGSPRGPAALRNHTGDADEAETDPVFLDEDRRSGLIQIRSCPHAENPGPVQGRAGVQKGVSAEVQRMVVSQRHQVQPQLVHHGHTGERQAECELLVLRRRPPLAEGKLLIGHENVRLPHRLPDGLVHDAVDSPRPVVGV